MQVLGSGRLCQAMSKASTDNPPPGLEEHASLPGRMPGGSCAPRLLPSQLRTGLHLHPLRSIFLPPVAEWSLLPGVLLPEWAGQRRRHLHRAVSLLKLCLQAEIWSWLLHF